MAGLALLRWQLPVTQAAGLTSSGHQADYLVLTNGSVLQGIVTHEGERYRVTLPKGEFSLATTQVDFVCNSLNEAYTRRKERLGEATLDTHLELARWCLQQKLYAQAAEELQAARKLQPRHPVLELLERQMEQNQTLTMPKATEASAGQQVNRQEQTPEHTPETGTQQVVSGWARVEFVKRVQPLLLSSCATGGCHVPDSAQTWQLDRRAVDGAGSPPLIQRNLHSVLAYCNLSDHSNSPLLVQAAAAHGPEDGARSQALTPRQLEILRAWFTQLDSQQTEVLDSEAGHTTVAAEMNSHVEPVSAVADPFDPSAFNELPRATAATGAISPEAIP